MANSTIPKDEGLTAIMTWRREAGLSDVLYRDQGIGYSSIMLPVTMFAKSSLFRNEFLLMTISLIA